MLMAITKEKNNNVDLQLLSQLHTVQKVFIIISVVYIKAELDTRITGDKSTPMT